MHRYLTDIKGNLMHFTFYLQ